MLGAEPVHDANCRMKAMAPETMPQERMIRAVQIRAPTRCDGGKSQKPVIAGRRGERVNRPENVATHADFVTSAR